MTIDQLVAMAQRVHDLEGYDLGASSTRDYRNAFWARVIGCAYHGHPVYHPGSGDKQWHLKSAGGGRPQSDDVATSMPSRAYWDCIAGVGADGYRFTVNGHAEPLPLDQEVYPPPVPAGSSGGGGGNGGGGGTQPTCQYQPTDLAPVLARLNDLDAAVAAATEAAREAQAAAVQTRAMLEGLIAQLQSPGMALDASVRVLGPIRGTVRLP